MLAINSILQTIGNTPVLSLHAIRPAEGAALFGKFEAANPSLSVKDRIALAMIEQAEKAGQIQPDTLIVDATAGNTGVALALVCAVKKLNLLIFMPEDASRERRKMIHSFGARFVVTPKEEGMTGAVKRAEEYVAEHTNCYWPRQFENPANPQAHRTTTAVELLADFPQGVDAMVFGVGTGGTLTGVGGEFKKRFPKMTLFAVEPSSSAILSGQKPGPHKIQQLGHGFVPGNLDRSLIDGVITVTDEEAYAMTRRLSREAGLLVGISSGANVHAAHQIASKLDKDQKVLTLLCDAGQRYFSIEKFFTNQHLTREPASRV